MTQRRGHFQAGVSAEWLHIHTLAPICPSSNLADGWKLEQLFWCLIKIIIRGNKDHLKHN